MVLAAMCYQIPWLAVTLLVLSIPLPWMAVLIANDRLPRKAETVNRYQPDRRRSSTREHPVIDAGPRVRRGSVVDGRVLDPAVTPGAGHGAARLPAAAPAAQPACSAARARPRSHATSSPASKASPAPVGSTTSAGRSRRPTCRCPVHPGRRRAVTAAAATSSTSPQHRGAVRPERGQLGGVGQQQVDAAHSVAERRPESRGADLRIHRRAQPGRAGRRECRQPRGPRRRVEQDVAGQVQVVGAVERRAGRPGASRAAAPRSESIVRSPPPTSTTTVQVGASGIDGERRPHPGRRQLLAAARPAGSSPTRATSVTSAPRWASHAAVFAPAPPARIRIRAGTSAPATAAARARPGRRPRRRRPPPRAAASPGQRDRHLRGQLGVGQHQREVGRAGSRRRSPRGSAPAAPA